MGQLKRASRSILLAVVLAVGALPPVATVAATEDLPTYTGREWTDLVRYGLSRLPGLAPPGTPGRITGSTTLDARIWDIAFARGYQMRPIATGTLIIQDGQRMQGATAVAWEAMQAEARRDGHTIVIASGFRSLADQRSILNSKLNGTSTSAIHAALKYSAPPGASLHQTGYALDLRTPGGTFATFRSSGAFRWLSANNYRNAKRFGFVPSYPDGAPSQGPVPEPWEYTYVGLETIRCGIGASSHPSPLSSCPRLATLLHGEFETDDTDLAIYDGRTGIWGVLNSKANRFVDEIWSSYATRTGWATHLSADFDGNGSDDIASFHPSNGTWWVGRSTGNSFTLSKWADFTVPTGWGPQVVGDFDGNGSDDIANYYPGNGTWWVSRSTGAGFSTELWIDFSTAGGWANHVTGDFDGNGSDDIASFHPSNGTWWVGRSTGNSFTLSKWADFTVPTGWGPQVVGDFDGNGSDDIANYYPGNGTWWVSVSNGSTFTTGKWAE